MVDIYQVGLLKVAGCRRKLHFTILPQTQHKNNFLPTSKECQSKWHFLYDCFIYCSNFIFQKGLEWRRHLSSGHKTVNSQGYLELWEPIKTHDNCYSLIW